MSNGSVSTTMKPKTDEWTKSMPNSQKPVMAVWGRASKFESTHWSNCSNRLFGFFFFVAALLAIYLVIDVDSPVTWTLHKCRIQCYMLSIWHRDALCCLGSATVAAGYSFFNNLFFRTDEMGCPERYNICNETHRQQSIIVWSKPLNLFGHAKFLHIDCNFYIGLALHQGMYAWIQFRWSFQIKVSAFIYGWHRSTKFHFDGWLSAVGLCA